MAITIIFGPPRVGKTALMSYFANEQMFNRERTRLMELELNKLNNNGFNLTIPKHCVCANYDVLGHKFGYNKRFARKINPFRLGYNNEFVKTHFIAPYSFICITEGQKYFNSRFSMYYPDWQSRWYEQHGHNYLDIMIDTQRPSLIDVNIRELADFIEVRRLDKVYDKNGEIKELIWTLRKISDSALLDKYLASGRTDNSCYEDVILKVDYNVFEIYDSRNCKPKHYDGHLYEDFDIVESKVVEQSFEGFEDYLLTNDDEYIKGFYQKRSIENVGVQKK